MKETIPALCEKCGERLILVGTQLSKKSYCEICDRGNLRKINISKRINEVSVIICSYNRKDDLLRCLESIDFDTSLEVIVIDNGSTDNSVNEIKKKYPNIIIINNSENKGASYARNQGILLSNGKYLWFLDSDSIVINKHCLENMLKLIKLNGVGAVGGEIIKDNGLKYRIVTNDEILIPVNEENKLKFNNFSVESLATCNCMIEKDLLLEIGGFDPGYFYLAEDLDICHKIKKKGFKIIFSSDCAVLHNFSKEGRTSNYYLLFRNSLRCDLINNSLLTLFTFPFTRIYKANSFSSKKDLNNLRTSKELQNKRNLIQLLGIAMVSLIGAYIWNIFYLPKTVYIKYKRPNFLQCQI